MFFAFKNGWTILSTNFAIRALGQPPYSVRKACGVKALSGKGKPRRNQSRKAP